MRTIFSGCIRNLLSERRLRRSSPQSTLHHKITEKGELGRYSTILLQVSYIWRNTVLGAITDKVADLHRAHGSHQPLRGEDKRSKAVKQCSFNYTT